MLDFRDIKIILNTIMVTLTKVSILLLLLFQHILEKDVYWQEAKNIYKEIHDDEK